MSLRFSPYRLVWFAFLLIGTSLRAHDPYEITAEFRSDAKYVELRLTFARQTAMKVARLETGGRMHFGPSQFEEVRPALEKCARRVIALRPLDPAAPALEPVELTAALTIESDIEFRAVFARPTAAKLNFSAPFLRELEDPGYVARVQWIEKGRVVSEARLQREEPQVELAVPSL